ncbi:hypothetical protein JR485_001533 [Escherichia coli]|uniref:hypothetical protein n=1 Tax=Escherichia coli TaxID=562 RepID=UPI000BDF1F33|nr:hypothetical protein [Escherichia coli]EFD4923045.1 hypothetical protein [Escherichia coli]EGL2089856.1 hypothetical protein [Escherichia coli]EHC9919465.1 hypothetical protein [Escherichia coli]EHS5724866.1 hypothetical protein [Escherichia coli]HAL3009382.1 hypothetical protein [Escherichia coli]
MSAALVGITTRTKSPAVDAGGGMVALMIAGFSYTCLIAPDTGSRLAPGNALLFIMLLIGGLCGRFSFGTVVLMVQ